MSKKSFMSLLRRLTRGFSRIRPTSLVVAVLLAGLSVPMTGSIALATASVGVGTSPDSIAVTPSGEFAYITLRGEAKVAKLRVSDSTVVGTIDVGTAPGGIVVEPAGEYAFVANRDSGTVSKIDIHGEGADTVVATLDVGGTPTSLAVTADSYNVYVTNPTFHTVQKLLSTGSGLTKLADIAVGINPVGIGIDPTNTFALVVNTSSETVSRISLSSGAVEATIDPTCTDPTEVAFHPADHFAYVLCNSGLRVIDTSTNTPGETLSAGRTPQRVTVTQNPTGLFALVTNVGDNSVSKIDLSAGTEVERIDVDAHPLGVAATPDGETAFVANNYYDTVSIVTLLGDARFPTFGTASSTADGFTVPVTNYDSAWQWEILVNTAGASASIDGNGLISVTGLAPGVGATLTVTSSRDGWLDGTGTTSGQAATGAALIPSLAAASATADGFTVQISNYTEDYVWAATFGGSDGLGHPAAISGTGLVTISGLPPSYSTSVTVTTTRSGYDTGSATRNGAALPGQALTPRVEFVSNDYAEMVAQVTNYDDSYGWAVVNDHGWASIDATGSITTRAIPGESVSVTVTASRSGYGVGSTVFTTTPPALVPVAPQDVSVSAGVGSVTVAWSPPFNDGGSDVNSYLVEYAEASQGPWSAASGSCAQITAEATSCQAAGLANGTNYWLRVAAVNSVGRGSWSDTVGPITPQGPQASPDPVTDEPEPEPAASPEPVASQPPASPDPVASEPVVSEPQDIAVTLRVPKQLATGQTAEVEVDVGTVVATADVGPAGTAVVSLNGSGFCVARITAGHGACRGKIRSRGSQSFAVVFTAEGGGSAGSAEITTRSASIAVISAVAGPGARCRQRVTLRGVAQRRDSMVRIMAKQGNRWVRVGSTQANARRAWRIDVMLPSGSRQVRASDGRTTTPPVTPTGLRCRVDSPRNGGLKNESPVKRSLPR